MASSFTIGMADRIKQLPPYLFARIDELKKAAKAKGVDVIDLSIGDPDIPTPGHIVTAMQKAVEKAEHHRYPSYEGMLSYREAAAHWCKGRFGIQVDPAREVLSLIGSKEGVGHLPLAFVNPGDVVLCPSPGYPVYTVGTLFAGGEAYLMPLVEANDYLPDFSAIPAHILDRAKLMYLNYPNNPTSAGAKTELFARAIELAHAHNILICHDAAYTEIYFDGKKPMSFLEMDGAKEVGMELHSLSKSYNMTGWRIGFAIGNSQAIAGLGKIKTNLDSGVFQAVQEASIAAFATPDEVLDSIRKIWQDRRDALYEGLREIGLDAKNPQATFYLWAKVPSGYTSEQFTIHLLDRSGVLGTPGNGFGAAGEGYIRFALTVDVDRIKEAVQRIKSVL